MNYRKFQLLLLVAIMFSGLVVSTAAQAQNNEIGLLIGAEFIPESSVPGTPAVSVRYGNSEAFQINYAHRLVQKDKIGLWLEVPALAGPSHSINGGNPDLPTSLATFYATPSFRIKFSPASTFAPWLSFGGGYTLFETSAKLASGTRNSNQLTSTAALQFGGGVDIKTPIHIFLPIALRAEVRDFYSLGAPTFSIATDDQNQHNVAVSGGLVLRF
jgi:hypothetical protein